MRNPFAATIRALALILALQPALAAAQVPQFPQTLPPNTVVGRLGIGPGPSQAIPFATLRSNFGLATYQTVSILDFKADPTGVLDSAPAVRTALATVPYGSTLLVPPGIYKMNSCVNGAVLDFSSFGNKGLTIQGMGWTMKTGGSYAAPKGSIFQLGSAIDDTCDFYQQAGSDIVLGGVQFKDFAVVGPGGTFSGTPVGRHAFHINGTNPAFYLTNFVLDHVFIDNMKTGYSIKVTGNNSAPYSGALAYSTIQNSQLMSINASYLGDAIKITGNTFGQNTTNDSRNVGIQFNHVSGATSTVIDKNVFSNFNGMIVVDGATKPIIRDNELELGPATANTHGSLIDLNGSISVVENATVTGNSISQNSTVGSYKPINVANSAGTQIYDNRIALAAASPYNYVTITGAASGTIIKENRCTYNNLVSSTVDFNCSLSSLGPYGSQQTPLKWFIPGETSGTLVVGTAINYAAGATILWPNPSSPTTDTLALLANVQTFTNKTISGLNNTITNVTAAGIAIGATVTGGTTTRVLYDSAGALGEYAQVPLAVGGTNASLTASLGGIFYSTATGGAILAGSSIVNKVLLSGATAAPTWSAAAYPVSTTINQLLYSSGTNNIAGLATANSSVLTTDGSGVPSFSTTLPNINHGTPTAIVLTNATGTAASLTAGSATTTNQIGGVDQTTAWTSYTPAISALSGGAPTSVTAITGAYKLIGKTCRFRVTFTITTNGAAATGITATLPFTAHADAEYAAGNKTNSVGLHAYTDTGSDATKVWIFSQTATYPGISGNSYTVSGEFETN